MTMPAVINFGEIYFTLNVIFVAIRVIIGSVHGIFLAQRKIELANFVSKCEIM
jgi:hypothetical protein